MLRTPPRLSEGESQISSPKTVTLVSKVRQSIGEWEAGELNSHITSPLTSKKTSKKTLMSHLKENLSDVSPILLKTKYPDRISEARAMFNKAKQHLAISKNLKTDIKIGVTEALDRLYEILKDMDRELKGKGGKKVNESNKQKETGRASKEITEQSSILAQMKDHLGKLDENNRRMEELKNLIEKQQRVTESITYASVAANQNTKLPSEVRDTLHSVVVRSTEEKETGEQVLERIRKVIDAKEGWIKVERVRKAKDRKIIMGFRTKEEQSKIKAKLEKSGTYLAVEAIENRDPLLMLGGVLSINTDEDILKAFRNQNKQIFHDLDEENNRIKIKYRRKTRNPHTSHVIVSVSPAIWKRAIEIGIIHIDLQRIGVTDQSPLVQCSKCLGYGHSKRYCSEIEEKCSHCGNSHKKAECPDWLAGTTPKCCNCVKAKLELTDHNAFSQNCPVRRKWDSLARASTAYC